MTQEQLWPSYEQLYEENLVLKRQLQAAQVRISELEGEVEKLLREGKRQAAPFRNREGPQRKPKKPGRKKGKRHGRHAHRAPLPPAQIDERHDAPLPDCCPHCGSRDVSETHTAKQYQSEIPRRPIYREFTIHLGCCEDCGRRLQGRHPLQTSDALGAAASQLGPEAHAAFVILNKGLGLAHGKCRQFFQEFFGLRIARATSLRSLLRTTKSVEPAYQQLRTAVRRAPWGVPDETGWRVEGQSAWLHVFATERATCFEIGDRSRKVAERLLGRNWPGTLIHDGLSIYDCFQHAFHQQCVRHLQRRCQELLETAVGGAVHLPRRILALIEQAFTLHRQWRGHRLRGDQLTDAGLTLACELQEAASGRFTFPANRRLAKHVLSHALHWFWFLIDPQIDATNYRAEQALRPAVVNRKVWGGNRTWRGAGTQGILTSLLVTLSQRSHEALAWFALARRSPTPLALPP